MWWDLLLGWTEQVSSDSEVAADLISGCQLDRSFLHIRPFRTSTNVRAKKKTPKKSSTSKSSTSKSELKSKTKTESKTKVKSTKGRSLSGKYASTYSKKERHVSEPIITPEMLKRNEEMLEVHRQGITYEPAVVMPNHSLKQSFPELYKELSATERVRPKEEQVSSEEPLPDQIVRDFQLLTNGYLWIFMMGISFTQESSIPVTVYTLFISNTQSQAETSKGSDSLKKTFNVLQEKLKETVDEVEKSDIGKRGKEVVGELGKTAQKMAESLSKSGEQIAKTQVFKSVSDGVKAVRD